MSFIYALFEPTGPMRLRNARYVGKSDEPRYRFMAHMYDRELRHNNHRCKWLRKLKRAGHAPRMRILEKVPYSEWSSAEQRWIAKARRVGARLTNCGPGGNGGCGWPPGKHHTPESRAKLSAALKGNKNGVGRVVSRATRRIIGQKVSAALTGRKLSPEQCEAIRQRMLGKRYGLGWRPNRVQKARWRAAMRKLPAGAQNPWKNRRHLQKVKPSDLPVIIALAASGTPRKAIAAQYGVTVQHVGYLLNKGKSCASP